MGPLFTAFSLTSVRANLVANFLGRAIQGFCAFFFVPFTILLIGVESYGLMAVYSSLQVVLFLLDFGLSAALNRELASGLDSPEKVSAKKDLVRSLEILYWGMAVFLCLFSFVLAPFLAGHWLKSNQLPVATIHHTVLLIGFVIGLQFPTILYAGGLSGLQQQVTLSFLTAAFAVAKGLGALGALWFISPTVEMFWLSQLVIIIIQNFTLRLALWKCLPESLSPPTFRRESLREIWRFAAGLAGINVLGVILTQADKVILSKLLNLEQFGYYSLATMASSGLYLVIYPMFAAVYPRFSQLLAEQKNDRLAGLYHASCQTLSVLVFPLALILSLFSSEVLLLWTRNPAVAENGGLVLSLHALGTALNGLMNIPYALQLAHGWTRLAFSMNLACVIVLVPLIILLTQKFQLMGAALGWVILNVINVTIGIQFMHAKILPQEKWAWYWGDVFLPALGAGLPLFFLRSAMPTSGSWELRVGILVGLWFLSVSCSALSSSFLRGQARTLWAR